MYAGLVDTRFQMPGYSGCYNIPKVEISRPPSYSSIIDPLTQERGGGEGDYLSLRELEEEETQPTKVPFSTQFPPKDDKVDENTVDTPFFDYADPRLTKMPSLQEISQADHKLAENIYGQTSNQVTDQSQDEMRLSNIPKPKARLKSTV